MNNGISALGHLGFCTFRHLGAEIVHIGRYDLKDNFDKKMIYISIIIKGLFTNMMYRRFLMACHGQTNRVKVVSLAIYTPVTYVYQIAFHYFAQKSKFNTWIVFQSEDDISQQLLLKTILSLYM